MLEAVASRRAVSASFKWQRTMGQTIAQKILARSAGLKRVEPGEIIEAGGLVEHGRKVIAARKAALQEQQR